MPESVSSGWLADSVDQVVLWLLIGRQTDFVLPMAVGQGRRISDAVGLTRDKCVSTAGSGCAKADNFRLRSVVPCGSYTRQKKNDAFVDPQLIGRMFYALNPLRHVHSVSAALCCFCLHKGILEEFGAVVCPVLHRAAPPLHRPQRPPPGVRGVCDGLGGHGLSLRVVG